MMNPIFQFFFLLVVSTFAQEALPITIKGPTCDLSSCEICFETSAGGTELNICSNLELEPCEDPNPLLKVSVGDVSNTFPVDVDSIPLTYSVGVASCTMTLLLRNKQINPTYVSTNIDYSGSCEVGVGSLKQEYQLASGNLTSVIIGKESVCGMHKNCGDCTDDDTCGWCETDETCYENRENSVIQACFPCADEKFVEKGSGVCPAPPTPSKNASEDSNSSSNSNIFSLIFLLASMLFVVSV